MTSVDSCMPGKRCILGLIHTSTSNGIKHLMYYQMVNVIPCAFEGRMGPNIHDIQLLYLKWSTCVFACHFLTSKYFTNTTWSEGKYVAILSRGTDNKSIMMIVLSSVPRDSSVSYFPERTMSYLFYYTEPWLRGWGQKEIGENTRMVKKCLSAELTNEMV